ncbi:MAG: class I SAM-dependent methyltransferase [Pseudomonadota bacterium]
MNQAPSLADWATDRGDKWRDHLDDLEAELEPLNTPLAEALALAHPARIADLGCGGGGASRGIFDVAPKGSEVIGFDVSPSLIEAARQRNSDRSDRLSFGVADLQTASPPSDRFDRLMSRFGVMFFPEPKAAFRNLARWLKPDGRFAFAVWAAPEENLWLSKLKQVVANYVDVPKPEPDAPGPFRYADVSTFVSLLSDSGFADVQATTWRQSIPIGGYLPARQAAEFAVAAFGIGSLLDELDHATKLIATETLADFFREYETDGVVRMPAAAHIVSGVPA